MTYRFIVASAAAIVLACVATSAQDPPAWPDTFQARVQALALIQTLNADVLGSRSATATLERWCRDHRLADDPTIVAALMRDVKKPATSELRQHLQVGEHDTVMFRHVRLRCGDRVLSEADNWYVPARLTAEMNRVLETTDTPFGRAVQSLEPYRSTLSARLLWSPLPERWERDSTKLPASTGRALAIPAELFEHRAILYTRDHLPFSEVDEIYQRQLLAFPPRR
jgi:chorismate-pyruvate lyase